MKTIAFHSNQLCLRGTEIALYTYADYNERILGNKSIILSAPGANLDALPKFQSRFETHLMNFGSYESFLQQKKTDFFYTIKGGNNDGVCMSSIPSLIHVVFRHNDPHGHRYRYVSDWLAADQGYDPEEYAVPHIVEPFPSGDTTMRDELGIPHTATVFGCYGGSTEFNISFVHDAIKNIVKSRADIHFIFMNINPFSDPHPQIHHVSSTWDLHRKASLVRACDAMIHARRGGETFGLAVAEFAMENKPIVTYSGSGEISHINILGERAICYSSYEDVLSILDNLTAYIKYDDYHLPYQQFSPEIVMEKFHKRFLT